MSNLTRRNFLSAVPLAGVAAGAALTARVTAPEASKSEPATQSGLGSPQFVARRRNQNDPNDRHGLVLKISGLTVTRIRPAQHTARTYFLNLPAAGYAAHFPQLTLPKEGLDPSSSLPDSVTETTAIYNLTGKCIIEGTAGSLALTMGTRKETCTDAYAAGLNSFMQPRAGFGWAYTVASDEQLEARSSAWFDFNRGRFEDPQDVSVGDPMDAATLVTDGKVNRVVKRVLYYGIPAAEKIKFALGNGKTVTVDTKTFQIVAGLAHIPLHVHKDQTAPQKLPDLGVLKQLMDTPQDVPDVTVVADCKTGQHLGCTCCDPVIEIL